MVRRELFTAVVGDVMDWQKLRRQFLPPQVKPLVPEMVLIGRAMTALYADAYEEDPQQPYGLMLQALDDLKPNEVYVCSGGSSRGALWGELMSDRALKCGAVGAVVNGYSRDTRALTAMGFPTFSRGGYAQGLWPRGRVVDLRVPIEMEGARIVSGDVIFGDLDGVCVIPREHEHMIFMLAFEKARKERVAKRDIEAGMSAVEVFKKHGFV